VFLRMEQLASFLLWVLLGKIASLYAVRYMFAEINEWLKDDLFRIRRFYGDVWVCFMLITNCMNMLPHLK